MAQWCIFREMYQIISLFFSNRQSLKLEFTFLIVFYFNEHHVVLITEKNTENLNFRAINNFYSQCF